MAELLSGSHTDSSLDLTRELPESVCFMHDGAPAVLLSMGRRLPRRAVGSLLSPFSHHLSFFVYIYWFSIATSCVTISAYSALVFAHWLLCPTNCKI